MKSIRVETVVMLFFALLAGCSGDTGDDSSPDESASPDDDTGADDDLDDDAVIDDDADDDADEPAFCDVDENRIDEIVAAWSLRRKVAQMYYVGVDIFPLFESPDAIEMVRDLGVGAVHEKILLTLGAWPEWTINNTNALQDLAMGNDPPVPLFIGIDQEGGIPQSLSSLFGGTDTPGNLGLGATFDPEATAASYGIMAEQLHTLGINVNLAPVLDVMTDSDETSMYTRSFGEITDEVAAHARAAVRATRRELVIPTPKHFPGQTAAPGDEHTSMPVAIQDEDTLRDVYLAPFAAAIEAGADMVMPTHARFWAFDPDYPASLSHEILTGVLREELGFEGVIITDDLNMVGVTGNDWGEMPDILAIQAGADMLMDIFEDFDPVASPFRAAPYPDTVAAQIDAVAAAVEDGRITPARIDESVRRILALKMKYCLFENPFREPAGAGARVDTPDQHALAASLHDRAVTLVRDDEGLVPIDSATTVHVIAPALVVWEAYPTAGWPNLAGETLLGAMRAFDPTAKGALFGSPTSPMAADAIVAGAEATDADVIVVATYNARDDDTQADMVRRILDLDRPTVIVSLAMPYDLSAFPDAPTYLAAYSNRDLAARAVARVLYGVVAATGRLPVGIPGLYEAGDAFGR